MFKRWIKSAGHGVKYQVDLSSMSKLDLVRGGFIPPDGNHISIQQAYDMVPWFGSSIDARSNAYSNLPWDLTRGDSVSYSSYSSDDYMAVPEKLRIFPILDDMFTHLDLYGAAYAIYETNKFGRNGAWRRLHPSTITPEYAIDGSLTGFKRRVKGASIMLDMGRLVYLWMPNHHAETGPGTSVAQRAIYAASTLMNAAKFKSYFFEKGAINPTIVKIAGFGGFDQEEKERTQSVLDRLFQGLRNAFNIIPLDGDVEVMPLIQSLSDMDLSSLTSQERENVAVALGVPQTLLLSNAANYATAQQDDFNLYDKWIVPLVRRVIEPQLNAQLFEPAGYTLAYRPERLEVFQQIELLATEKLVPWYDRRVIDINEVREELGRGPLESASVDDVPERLLAPEDDVQIEAAEVRARRNVRPEALADLDKWMRKALKRFDEGTPEKAHSFTSEHLPAVQIGAIAGALESAQDSDHVRLIFEGAKQAAAEWRAYG